MNTTATQAPPAAPADNSVAGEEDPGAALDTLAKPPAAAGRKPRLDDAQQEAGRSPNGPAKATPGDRDPDAAGDLSSDAPP